MKTSVIPAQITTVEDKIAGNLNLTQVILLLLALMAGTFVYALFPPVMKISYYKIPVVLIAALFFLVLALRVRGKVILDWLLVLIRYNIRPKYYLYNKNKLFLREIFQINEPKVKKAVATKPKEQEQKAEHMELSLTDLSALENLLANPNYNFSFKAKKGGLNVVASQIQR